MIAQLLDSNKKNKSKPVLHYKNGDITQYFYEKNILNIIDTSNIYQSF